MANDDRFVRWILGMPKLASRREIATAIIILAILEQTGSHFEDQALRQSSLTQTAEFSAATNNNGQVRFMTRADAWMESISACLHYGSGAVAFFLFIYLCLLDRQAWEQHRLERSAHPLIEPEGPGQQ